MLKSRLWLGLLGGIILAATACAGLSQSLTAGTNKPALSDAELKGMIRVLKSNPFPRYIGAGSGKILVAPLKSGDKRAFVARDIDELVEAVVAISDRDFGRINEMEKSGELWIVESNREALVGKRTRLAVYSIAVQKSWVEILEGPYKGKSGWMLNMFLDMDLGQYVKTSELDLQGMKRFEDTPENRKVREIEEEIMVTSQ